MPDGLNLLIITLEVSSSSPHVAYWLFDLSISQKARLGRFFPVQRNRGGPYATKDACELSKKLDQ